ncbi:hypothetical protein A3F06_03815 [candidate division TM6 bacterium RIFCSPHIGHO2_12_FULL_36_22]|nr:MAG: hypothetical protein A3F06_03815 [candidate division TM6 bacterium RIFCSPHIGHO2_12_FULL_36_22]
MKNKKLFLSTLLGLLTISGLFAQTADRGNAAVMTSTEVVAESAEDNSARQAIVNVVYATLNAHSDSLGQTFADDSTEIITEMWIGQLAGTALGIQQQLISDDGTIDYTKLPEMISQFIGSNLILLPQKISEVAQAQVQALQEIILEEMDSAEIDMPKQAQQDLASIMATEIINSTIYAYILSFKGPSMATIALHEGYKGMKVMVTELTKLKNQYAKMSLDQKSIIAKLKRQIKDTKPEFCLTKKKLEKELIIAQEHKKYVNNIHTALAIKLGVINSADWVANSKWTWLLRFTAKNSAKLGYKTIKLFV